MGLTCQCQRPLFHFLPSVRLTKGCSFDNERANVSCGGDAAYEHDALERISNMASPDSGYRPLLTQKRHRQRLSM
eukprot:362683-Amphidinium_carterae.2